MYERAADEVLNATFATSQRAWLPCNSADAACLRRAIASFAERAWRRPLEDAEVERLVSPVASASAAGLSWEENLKAGLESRLDSLHTRSSTIPWSTFLRTSRMATDTTTAIFPPARSGGGVLAGTGRHSEFPNERMSNLFLAMLKKYGVNQLLWRFDRANRTLVHFDRMPVLSKTQRDES